MFMVAVTAALPAPHFTWRLAADRVLVTWGDLLGLTTELRVSYPNGELTLSRAAGAELPPDAFCRIIEEVAAALRLGPPAPHVVARWATLCSFEPELADFVRDWPTIKLRGAMEHVARISIPDARVYVRMIMSAGAWRKAVAS